MSILSSLGKAASNIVKNVKNTYASIPKSSGDKAFLPALPKSGQGAINAVPKTTKLESQGPIFNISLPKVTSAVKSTASKVVSAVKSVVTNPVSKVTANVIVKNPVSKQIAEKTAAVVVAGTFGTIAYSELKKGVTKTNKKLGESFPDPTYNPFALPKKIGEGIGVIGNFLDDVGDKASDYVDTGVKYTGMLIDDGVEWVKENPEKAAVIGAGALAAGAGAYLISTLGDDEGDDKGQESPLPNTSTKPLSSSFPSFPAEKNNRDAVPNPKGSDWSTATPTALTDSISGGKVYKHRRYSTKNRTVRFQIQQNLMGKYGKCYNNFRVS